ncbi:hypothetical protein CsSME_00003593 [Camellia sinensis var. sinensis]
MDMPIHSAPSFYTKCLYGNPALQLGCAGKDKCPVGELFHENHGGVVALLGNLSKLLFGSCFLLVVPSEDDPVFSNEEHVDLNGACIKEAQKLLDDILEKTIEIVQEPIHVLDDDPMINDNGVRLFKHAPPGIVFDHREVLWLYHKNVDTESTFREQLGSYNDRRWLSSTLPAVVVVPLNQICCK